MRLAWLPNPHLTPGAGCEWPWPGAGADAGGRGELDLTDRIHRHLIACTSSGEPGGGAHRTEAQALPDETLEAIRLFGNLGDGSRKLLQIVLFGQPELDARLGGSPACASCASASASPTACGCCSTAETRAYLEYRLQVSGYRRGRLFEGEACAGCGAASRGILASSTYWRRSA